MKNTLNRGIGSTESNQPIAITEDDINKWTNIEKVLFFFGNVWSHPYNVDLIDLLMLEDFTITTAGKVISGRDEFKQWVQQFLSLMHNSDLKVLDAFESACNTKVVVRWELTGINNGILGLAPNREALEFSGTAVWLIKEGKLAHNWVERNAFEVYQKHSKGSDTPNL